ncbi:hypothetical protein HAX54_030257 [Datura stramonium]|uniref:Uncharacterized protein n=1 Tax=Datura stramonium TaxID=4076 RepID=A0ABS8VAG8_DATST|nr:hypothetical protein [Datura stramonium]
METLLLGRPLLHLIISPAWQSPSGDFALGFHQIEAKNFTCLGISSFLAANLAFYGKVLITLEVLFQEETTITGLFLNIMVCSTTMLIPRLQETENGKKAGSEFGLAQMISSHLFRVNLV